MKKLISIFFVLGMVFGQVDYGSQIQTILNSSCTNCHGNSGGLSLGSYDALMNGGNSGDAVIPGDHESSLLWQRIESGEMPPNGNLDPEEINIIAEWIDEGAYETPQVDVAGLFFSEYGEGSANNKYLEIYNGTGSEVDLSGLAFPNVANDPATEGEYEYWNTFPAGAVIASGDVYVIAHGEADEIIVAQADHTFTYLSNGNDGFCLVEGTEDSYTIVDCIGDWNGDPGDGWDVAGIPDATMNHTLVRHSDILEGNGGDWVASAGTSEDDSEWIVLDQDTWDYLGSHPHEISGPIPTITVNEFLADAGDCCGVDMFGEGQDFIELYNYGSEVVDITGWGFGDTDGEVETIATDTSIAPDEFMILWFTGNDDAIFPEIDAKLSGSGEAIYIEDANGNTVVYMEYGEQSEDISYGRVPDGEDTWQYLDPPSPGESNESTGGNYTSIYDIQYVESPDTDDASPLNGEEVTIHGVVTAEFWGSDQHRYMHVQDAEGPWNGIVCFEYDGWDSFDWLDASGNAHPGPGEGDEVTLTGTVEEYYNLTELVNVTSGIVHDGQVELTIEASLISLSDIGEAYEGCLIRVEDVAVTNPDLGYGEWEFGDGELAARCDDKWDYYYYPTTGHQLATIEGVVDYNFSNYKLQPRLARDVVEEGNIRIQRVQQVLYSDLMKAGEDSESDISYMLGDTVTLEGIVTMPTGLSYAGSGVKFIFADVNGGPWSALLSYDPDSSAFPTLFEGDLIQATGYVYEYTTGPANMTELFITQPINILNFEQPLPVVDTVNTGDLRWPTEAEQWGNVMVRVEEAIVTGNDFQYEVFAADDGSGSVLIDDDSDSLAAYFETLGPPPVGSLIQSMEGWLYHHYGSYADSTAYKLCPLYEDNIEFGSGPPSITGLSREPCAPTADDNEVAISCVILDNSTISEALVYYSIDGSAYQYVSMETNDDSTFTGVIPVADGNTVYYYITATDDGESQSEPKTSIYPYDIEHEQLGFHIADNLTISMIQETPWPAGNTLYEGCTVTLNGIVTADTAQYNSSYSAYALQDGSGQWNGMIFDTDEIVQISRGDDVSVVGLITEYAHGDEFGYQLDGNTRLINASVSVNSSGNDTPAPVVASCEDLSQIAEEVESYEGVLVKLNNVTISAVNQYDWSITDESGFEALIDDDMATMEADNMMSSLTEGQGLDYLMGIFNYSYGTYKIQIRDANDMGQFVGINDDIQVNPYQYTLHDNFPNPFNPETQIRFSIGARENVQLLVYDIMGRQVRTLVDGQELRGGFHVVNWNGLDNNGQKVPSGLYIYRIKAGDFIADKKMLLVK